MRLLSCHVNNFGKISDLSIDFTDGVNLFHEPNAWGKSTLAAFLRVMFYGFDSKRESGSFDKERVVYKPWQGGIYGGEVDFSYKDKTYRISRTFGKTEKTDAFHLYDLATNLECHDFSSDIGSEIFGLDSTSFKRSAFIAQNDCECGSTDAINAKLGNLVENTNDINNFDTAQKRIHDRMNKLSPDRATGSMRKRTNTMTLLAEELRSFDAAEEAAKELAEKLVQKQEQRRELSDIRSQYAKALQVASEESRRESERSNYQAICREAEESKERLESFQKLFPERVPREEEFAGKNQEVQMLGVLRTTIYNLGLTEEEKTQYRKLSDVFSNGIPTEQEISDAEQEVERLGKLREEKVQLETKMSYFEAMAMKREAPDDTVQGRKAMQICGILLLMAGIACCIAAFAVNALAAFFLPFVIGGGVAAVLGVALLVIRKMKMSQDEEEIKEKRLKYEAEEQKLRAPVEEIQKTMEKALLEIKRMEQDVESFLGNYQIFSAAPDERSGLFELRGQIHDFERLKIRADKSEVARTEYEQTKSSVLAFGRESGIDFGEDLAGSLSRMQLKAAEYRMAQRAYEQALSKKALFEEEHDMQAMMEEERCPYSLDELNSMISQVDDRLEDVREGIEQYNHQMEDLQEQLDLRDEKEQQLSICREEQEQEKHLYEILGLTQDYLKNAKEQFSARYLGPIEGGFGKYYELLTGDESGDWMVNANIAVQMKEQGEMRETKWLSAGYQDLLGVCMRLALVDAMYPEEKPFLVMDDPFVNLDEEKIAHGAKLLEKMAEEYQILYFTCHESRMM